MDLLIVLIVLLLFVLPGTPLALAFALCAAVCLWHSGSWTLTALPDQMLRAFGQPLLLAIPLFAFAGEIMAAGGLARRVLLLSQLLVGRMRGGLGYAAILSSALFAALTGGSSGTVAALGILLLPMMRAVDYYPARGGALLALGGMLHPLIPLGMPLLVLVVASGLEGDRLFLAGLAPGLLMGAALSLLWFFLLRRDGCNERVGLTSAQATSILMDCIPDLLMPLLVVVLLRLQLCTLPESGAFAVAYALLLGVLYNRDLSWRTFLHASGCAARTASTLLLLASAAAALHQTLANLQIPVQLAKLCQFLMPQPGLLLFCLLILLFLSDVFMGLAPTVLLCIPLLFPLIQQAGLDPYHFSLLALLCLGLASFAPPEAPALHEASRANDLFFSDLAPEFRPFLWMALVVLLGLACCPQLVLTPLRWFTGG